MKQKQKPPSNQTMAEKLSAVSGSWRFINIQSIVVAVWIAYNGIICFWFGFHPFDAFPFVLLNLAFSTQAAYTGPIVLMAQNAQAKRDKVRDAKMEEMTQNIDQHTQAILALAKRADERDERNENMLLLLTDVVKEQTMTIQRMSEIMQSEKV